MKRTFLTLLAGVLLLGACSGSAKTSTTTVPADAPETTIAPLTPAETTVAGAGAPTTVAGDAASTSLDIAAAAADPLAAVQGLLGITDPKDLACIKAAVESAPAGAAGASAAGIDPVALKAVIKCQPPQIVSLLSAQIAASLPKATPEQVDCVAKATLAVLAESDGDVLSALTGGAASAPKELQEKLVEKAKPCGLSEGDLKIAAGQAGN
jgi:hypothetical protein